MIAVRYHSDALAPWNSPDRLIAWTERWLGMVLPEEAAEDFVRQAGKENWPLYAFGPVFCELKFKILPLCSKEPPPRPRANPDRINYPIQAGIGDSGGNLRQLGVSRTGGGGLRYNEMSPAQEVAWRAYEDRTWED